MKIRPKKTNNRGMGFSSQENTPSNQGINYLLSIAIDKYQNFPILHNCVKDATDIVSTLVSRYQFEEEHVYTLYNEEATTDQIFKKFEVLAQKIRPIDNLIIYFAGHGKFKQVFNEGYWIPVNAKSNRTSHFIPNSEIKTMLSAINTKHTFLIVDSCFSGSLFARGGTRNIAERVERYPSRWGLTSGRSEIVSDGEPGVNSPFASSILYLLKNNRKQLGVQELCAYVIESVISTAIQTPIGEPLIVPGHKGGQFVFRLKENFATANNNTHTTTDEPDIIINSLTTSGATYEHSSPPNQNITLPKWVTWAVPLAIIGVYLITFLIPANNDTPYLEEDGTVVLQLEEVDSTDENLKHLEEKINIETDKTISENNNIPTKTTEIKPKQNQKTQSTPIQEKVKPKTNYQPKEPVENNIVKNTPPPVVKKEPVVTPPPVESKIPAPILNLKNNMVRVKRGKFVMGSEHEKDAPLHVVQVSRGYYIGKTEVTQELWKSVMNNNPSFNKGCDQCPVENISFYEVQDFMEKLNKITGQRFRLPSEAEWEYAAIAGKLNDLYYQESANVNRLAYFRGNAQSTKPVGKKTSNKLGVHDMLGNVSEWCLDWYAEDFYKDNDRNPLNKNRGVAASKIIRGGSFMSSEEKCNVYNRAAMAPNQRKNFIGFRLVRD